MSEKNKSYKMEFSIAVIALTTALVSNWDKINPKKEIEKQSINSMQVQDTIPKSKPTMIELSASFDCRKAQTNIEKIICKDSTISHADGQLGILYKKIKNDLSANNYSRVQKEQRLWIKQRDEKILNICQSTEGLDVDCVVRIYEQRTYELNKILSK